MNKSEVAQLRERIAQEYEAAKRVFTEVTLTARHDFITKRQENVAIYFEELQHYMSPEEAMELIVQVGNDIQGASVSSEHTL